MTARAAVKSGSQRPATWHIGPSPHRGENSGRCRDYTSGVSTPKVPLLRVVGWAEGAVSVRTREK